MNLCNHELAKLSTRKLRRAAGQDVSDLRHPVLERTYFAEFEPLLKRKGVKGFRREFGIERMVLEAHAEHRELERYLDRILRHGRRRGIPVLGFNRSTLRVPWMRRRFDATHVYIDRCPAEIWGSYVSQLRDGNPWFLANWLAIVEANADARLLQPLARRLQLGIACASGPRPTPAHIARARGMRADESYLLTFYLWLACATHALKACDAVIDMDRMDEPHYRHLIEEELGELCGVRLDFHDARRPSHPDLLPWRIRQRAEAEARDLLSEALQSPESRRLNRHLDRLHERKAELIAAHL